MKVIGNFRSITAIKVSGRQVITVNACVMQNKPRGPLVELASQNIFVFSIILIEFLPKTNAMNKIQRAFGIVIFGKFVKFHNRLLAPPRFQ